MKFHLIMYLANIAKDIKTYYMNSNIKKLKNILPYYSELIEKIELSVEMIIEIIFNKRGEDILFEKKKYVILILEIIRMINKVKELYGLNDKKYDFYIEKAIYHDQVLGISEDELNTKLDTSDSMYTIYNIALMI
jgi:hypothetical protein